MIGALTATRRDRRPFSFGRFSLFAVMLLAFVFQAYLTQTHIHRGDPFAAQTAQLSVTQKATAPAVLDQKIAGQSAPKRDNFPANDDPANCPICQQIAGAGQFVAPAWLLPLLVAMLVSTVQIVAITRPHYDTVSHNWRGRGPPRR